ncbi:MAG: hypothetical protein R3298_03740 [Gammaproteobacteria bacterium]|nr:hypothetical protein [Gammaproteobacteria bacterium]
MTPHLMSHYTPGDGDASAPACPLCANLDHVERPMVRHLDLRDDLLVTRWHCDHCQASFTLPEPTPGEGLRFGESRLA